jgi:hypothetical protein
MNRCLDNLVRLGQNLFVMSEMENNSTQDAVFDGIHGTITIHRPAPGVVLVIFTGPDLGEFGDKPFHELAKDLATGLPLELFIDASGCIGPTVNVSSDWAQWMITHRTQLYRVNLLSGSRYVEVTANFVRRFTEFGERMRIYTDNDAFYRALSVGSGKSALKSTAL